jgi:hypothetical protein
MLEIFTSIAICLTLIPGISFFLNQWRRQREWKRKFKLDEDVNHWRDGRDPQKLEDAVNKRGQSVNRLFSYQHNMDLSNNLLAGGACSFAIIEVYKLLSRYIHGCM